MYVCMYVYIYTHAHINREYMYTHTHTHTHAHTHTHKQGASEAVTAHSRPPAHHLGQRGWYGWGAEGGGKRDRWC